MANKRNNKAASGRDQGGFVALPWSVLDCPAYEALSHPAKALLLELARQFVRDNNGKLLASRAHLKSRGWKSADVIDRAKRELLEAGFIHETVKGHRPNKASWYAITWQSLDRHHGYDHGVVEGFERGAYRKTAPVKNASLSPSNGTERCRIGPSGGTGKPRSVPGGGPIEGDFQGSPVPSAGHHLEKPSTAVVEPAPSSALTAVASDRESAPATNTECATQPETISTLADLWAAVGCRSVWTKPKDVERERLHQLAKDSAATACQTTAKRMQAARDAEAHAKARQANRTKPAAMALAGAVHVDHDGLTRERDEHAHDLAAWAD
jgi:hypothetical protein